MIVFSHAPLLKTIFRYKNIKGNPKDASDITNESFRVQFAFSNSATIVSRNQASMEILDLPRETINKNRGALKLVYSDHSRDP